MAQPIRRTTKQPERFVILKNHYHCGICDMGFAGESYVKKHITLRHKVDPENIDPSTMIKVAEKKLNFPNGNPVALVSSYSGYNHLDKDFVGFFVNAKAAYESIKDKPHCLDGESLSSLYYTVEPVGTETLDSNKSYFIVRCEDKYYYTESMKSAISHVIVEVRKHFCNPGPRERFGFDKPFGHEDRNQHIHDIIYGPDEQLVQRFTLDGDGKLNLRIGFHEFMGVIQQNKFRS